MCGSECLKSSYWCHNLENENDVNASKCDGVSRFDSRLCGNPLVFGDKLCSENVVGTPRIQTYGQRCTGRNQDCIYPWYTYYSGRTSTTETCLDKSAKIFNISFTCRDHIKKLGDYHTANFCNFNYPLILSQLICTNKTEWLYKQDPSLIDGHKCQASCSSPEPDLDCVACTNPEYFNCTKSGQCVHPNLECDGHPQCTEGEDEDLEKCYTEYVKNHIIEPFASYRCVSVFYEKKKMEIFATPCNGKKECADNSDESGCDNKSSTSLVLTISLFAVLLVFLASSYFRGGLNFKSRKVGSKIIFRSTQEFLEKHENNCDVNKMSKS